MTYVEDYPGFQLKLAVAINTWWGHQFIWDLVCLLSGRFLYKTHETMIHGQVRPWYKKAIITPTVLLRSVDFNTRSASSFPSLHLIWSLLLHCLCQIWRKILWICFSGMKEVHTENVGSLELFISIYQLQLKLEQDVLFQKLIFHFAHLMPDKFPFLLSKISGSMNRIQQSVLISAQKILKIRFFFNYSQVANKRVGPNKRGRWLFWANFINK